MSAPVERPLWIEAVAAGALYAALTVVMAWPLSAHPGSTVLPLGADTNLFLWTIGWDLHAIVHQPLSIFDANIFYPLPHTLAYSENADRQRAAGGARSRRQRQSGAGPQCRAAAGVRALWRRHVRPRTAPRDEPWRVSDRRPDLRVQPAALSAHRAVASGDDSVAAILPGVAAHVPQDPARASRMVGVRLPRHRAPHERSRHDLHPARVSRIDRLACGVRSRRVSRGGCSNKRPSRSFS